MSEAPWTGHERRSREYRRILIGLSAAGLATFAQIYSPQGLLPTLALELHRSPADAALTVSLATLGVALSVIVWSWVADRIGRLPAMRIAIVSAAIFGVAVALMPSLEALVAVRFVEGLALGGLPALAIAYLHDEVHPRDATAAAAAYISGTTIGGAGGRLIAAPLAEWWGWRPAMLAIAVISAIAAVVFLWMMPTARGFVHHESVRLRALLGRVRDRLRDSTLRRLFLEHFLLMSAFVAVYNYLAFRIEAPPFLLPPSVAALIFLAYGAGTISSRQVGHLVPRFGSKPVVLAGLGVTLAGLAVLAIDHMVLIGIGLVIFTGGFFMTHTAALSWVGAHAKQGRSQATALYNVGMYAGSALGGWLVGYAWIAWGWLGVTLICAALVVGSAALVASIRVPRAIPPAG